MVMHFGTTHHGFQGFIYKFHEGVEETHTSKGIQYVFQVIEERTPNHNSRVPLHASSG